MQSVFVARRPVFDRALDLVAYEIIATAEDGDDFGGGDMTDAVSRLVLEVAGGAGVDSILGDRPAGLSLSPAGAGAGGEPVHVGGPRGAHGEPRRAERGDPAAPRRRRVRCEGAGAATPCPRAPGRPRDRSEGGRVSGGTRARGGHRGDRPRRRGGRRPAEDRRAAEVGRRDRGGDERRPTGAPRGGARGRLR